MDHITLFFFKSITNLQWKPKYVELLHFLPFILFVLIIPSLSEKGLSYRQVHYGMLSVFDYRKKTVTPFEYLYSYVFFMQFIHFGIYLMHNLILLSKYSTLVKKEYSVITHLQWLKLFHLLLIGILILVSCYLYVLFKTDLYRRQLDYIYAVPIGIFIYSISYRLAGILIPFALRTFESNFDTHLHTVIAFENGNKRLHLSIIRLPKLIKHSECSNWKKTKC